MRQFKRLAILFTLVLPLLLTSTAFAQKTKPTKAPKPKPTPTKPAPTPKPKLPKKYQLTLKMNIAPAEQCIDGSTVEAVATVTYTKSGSPVPGAIVNISVYDGPNAGTVAKKKTGKSGTASFVFSSNSIGIDKAKSRAILGKKKGYYSNILSGLTWEWIVCNRPPDVSNAVATPNELWPPNNKMATIAIDGVVDPDGDDFDIIILGITSDEPSASPSGKGKGKGRKQGKKHQPDASGIGQSEAQVRAERAGKGDGRVYVISFVAIDEHGAAAYGDVSVSVPHNRGKNGTAVDSGQYYDATQ